MSFALAFTLALAAPAAEPASAPVPRCGYRIVQTYPHDANSFTQGLFWHGGHLYETTGQYGSSRVARLSYAFHEARAR